MSEKNLEINIGLSPCPNDTFIFNAMLHAREGTKNGLKYRAHMADVETLNSMALAGELEITKISLGVMPYIMDKYALLSAGAALGWGCGPLVVAREPRSSARLRSATVAIPGKMTTANLLLDLTGKFAGQRREMVFSDVIPSVVSGECDLGVIIHEGRFTYEKAGLVKILDLGQWWEENFHLPLPLGAIAIRRDAPEIVGRGAQKDIADSLREAWANPGPALEFARQNAQELDDAVIRAHIKTFVTDYSLDLGDAGKKAIISLMEAAGKKSPANGYFIN